MSEVAQPWGLKWRSSVGFTTFVVGCGIGTDLLIYSLVIPVVPFQLEKLGYSGVSNLTGWLLFAFSGGLVISTPPLASLSEKYSTRRAPLIFGLLLLIGSQIMFMEAPTYWVMCLARVIQGFSSSVVWIVGLALLCDVVPEEHVGKQLGLAMTGMTLGLLLGAPVGGALYGAFGFRGPFIFGIIITVLDLIGRLLIIERKDALRYGYDPTLKMVHEQEKEADVEDGTAPTKAKKAVEGAAAQAMPAAAGAPAIAPEEVAAEQAEGKTGAARAPPAKIGILRASILLAKSPRAMAAYLNTFAMGVVLTAIEPALPLHMQAVWGYNSTKVGLVSIAATVPTIFASPLAGWLADRTGAERVTTASFLLTIPWLAVFVLPKSVVLFIVCYALTSFFVSGGFSPVMADLAAVGHSMDIGFAHVYGVFNLAYGLGNAVGPVIGGQVYDHVRHGWAAVCYICIGMFALAATGSFFCAGVDPLAAQLRRRLRGRREEKEASTPT